MSITEYELFSNDDPCWCRSCSGPRPSTQASKPQPKAPIPQQKPVDTIKRANFRELDDSYLIWADLPGKDTKPFSKSESFHSMLERRRECVKIEYSLASSSGNSHNSLTVPLCSSAIQKLSWNPCTFGCYWCWPNKHDSLLQDWLVRM